jgi:hypothetical protein
MSLSLRGAHQKTLGADEGYDTRHVVADRRIIGITPHVAQNLSRSDGCAIDGVVPTPKVKLSPMSKRRTHSPIKRKRHPPEQIIRKLGTAEQFLNQG